MKTRRLFNLLSIITMAAAGAFAIGAGMTHKKAETVEAAGYKYSAGTIIYLDPSSFNSSNNWTGGYMGAWCHYKSSNSSHNDMWEEFSYDGLSGKYYITLSYECASFTMARYSTSGGSRHHKTSWGSSVWNEGNFEFVSGKNYLYATGFMTGSWQTLTYHLAGTHNSWSGTDSNYKMTDGFDDGGLHQASIKITTTADNVQVKCTTNYNGTVPGDNWYGTLESGYNTNYIGTSDGNILLKKAGEYEIYLKNTRKVWAQISSDSEADIYATDFLSAITCTSDSYTFSINTWNNVSGTASMEYKFTHLTLGAQNVLKGTTGNQNGTNIQKCIARYDRILSKYGYGSGTNQLHDFMGRTPALLSGSRPLLAATNFDKSSNILIITIISMVSVSAIGGYFFLRKRKESN